jgi:hypothetical protein
VNGNGLGQPVMGVPFFDPDADKRPRDIQWGVRLARRTT